MATKTNPYSYSKDTGGGYHVYLDTTSCRVRIGTVVPEWVWSGYCYQKHFRAYAAGSQRDLGCARTRLQSAQRLHKRAFLTKQVSVPPFFDDGQDLVK